MLNAKTTYIFNITTDDDNAHDELIAVFKEHSDGFHHAAYSNGTYNIIGRITSGYPESVTNVVARNIQYVTSYSVTGVEN